MGTVSPQPEAQRWREEGIITNRNHRSNEIVTIKIVKTVEKTVSSNSNIDHGFRVSGIQGSRRASLLPRLPGSLRKAHQRKRFPNNWRLSCATLKSKMVVFQIRGHQHRPQYIILPIIGSPKKVPLILGNPQIECSHKGIGKILGTAMGTAMDHASALDFAYLGMGP